MVPGLIIGVALLLLYSSYNMPASLASRALGQTMLATPYVIRLALASLVGVGPRLERASRVLGGGAIQTFWKITLPLIPHGLIAGAIVSSSFRTTT